MSSAISSSSIKIPNRVTKPDRSDPQSNRPNSNHTNIESNNEKRQITGTSTSIPTPSSSRPMKKPKKSASSTLSKEQTLPRSTMTPPPSTSNQLTNMITGSGKKRKSTTTNSVSGTPSSNQQSKINPNANLMEIDEDVIENEEDFPMIRCGWRNCRQAFWILEDLLEHLVGEKGHVPVDPNAPRGQKCPCEWTGCPKAGKPQGSRMALLVHLRSHTGEKPFCCHKPECDKTFSRTDALAKHVRVSHGEPLPPGRKTSAPGNSLKKIKGEDSEGEDAENYDEPGMEGIGEVAGRSTGDGDEEKEDLLKIMKMDSKLQNDEVDEEGRTAEERKVLEDLKIKYPPTDPAFLELLILRAKFKFLLGEKEILEAELKALEHKEGSIKRHKDFYLDSIMKHELGPESSEMWASSIDDLKLDPGIEKGSIGSNNQSLVGSSSGTHAKKRIKTEPIH